MRFHEYLDRRQVESQLERCAEIMAAADIDPEVFVEGFVSEYDLQEGWRDFWQGAKDYAKNAWGNFRTKWYDHAASNKAPVSIWDSMARKAFADKHTKAIRALQDLHNFLSKNQQARGLLSKNKTNMSVADYIGELLKKLEQETGISQLAQGKEVQDGSRAPDMAGMMRNWQAGQQANQMMNNMQTQPTAGVQQNASGNQTTVSSGNQPAQAGGVWTT